MKIGYYDAKRMVYGLKGKIYYIEENQEECYYLKQLVQIPESSLERLCRWHHFKGSAETRYRSLTELILPGTALELKLSKRVRNYKGTVSGGTGSQRRNCAGYRSTRFIP